MSQSSSIFSNLGFPTLPYTLSGVQANPPAPPQNPIPLPVEFVESREHGSPRARSGEHGLEIERDYYCSWSNAASAIPTLAWFDALKSLQGYPILQQSNGGWYISRYLPHAIPYLTHTSNGFGTQQPYMYCTDANSQGHGDQPLDNIQSGPWQENLWGTAEITATYQTLSYDILDDVSMVTQGYIDSFGNPDESSLRRFVTRLGSQTTSYQMLPQGSFVLVGPTLPYPGTPGYLEGKCDVSLTWHQVPTQALGFRLLNWDLANTVGGQPYIAPIEDCLGKVNLFTFARYPRGTLLLTAVVIKPIKSIIGPRLWDVEYRFQLLTVQTVTQISTTPSGDPPVSITGYAYGHNLVPYVQTKPSGYYEIVSGSPGTYNGVTTTDSDLVTVTPNTNGLLVGMGVFAPAGIPLDTQIQNVVSSNQIQLNQAATASGSVPLTISALGIGSNYLQSIPADGVNLFSYRDFAPLFRVPQLSITPGNT